MTDHPSTFKAEFTHSEGVDWDDRAELRPADSGSGLFNGASGLIDGTLAEMVAHVAALPEEERGKYVIHKSGDHRLGTAEIMALAERPDFPR